MSRCFNRLIVLGAAPLVNRFRRSRWERQFKGKHPEPLEWSKGRFSCQFETEGAPLEALRSTARQQPGLTFLLDYLMEKPRLKGLAKARSEHFEQYGISY